jgi:hypothetical protein
MMDKKIYFRIILHNRLTNGVFRLSPSGVQGPRHYFPPDVLRKRHKTGAETAYAHH